MTPEDMRHDLELSLKALRTDTIDIYFYHRDNLRQNVEDEIETMETFRREKEKSVTMAAPTGQLNESKKRTLTAKK